MTVPMWQCDNVATCNLTAWQRGSQAFAKFCQQRQLSMTDESARVIVRVVFSLTLRLACCTYICQRTHRLRHTHTYTHNRKFALTQHFNVVQHFVATSARAACTESVCACLRWQKFANPCHSQAKTLHATEMLRHSSCVWWVRCLLDFLTLLIRCEFRQNRWRACY